jgi:hypothetical protein
VNQPAPAFGRFRSKPSSVPVTSSVEAICQHSDLDSQRCLAPGWGVWFASIQAGRSRCQAPGKWMRFASIPTQGPQLVPGGTATGAWHRVGSSLLASGHDLHDLKVPSTMALLVRLAIGCRRQVTPDGSQPMPAVGRSHKVRQPVCCI